MVTSHLEGSDDLYRMVAYAFGLEVADMDRATLLRCLEVFLIERAQEHKHALLIVDETAAIVGAYFSSPWIESFVGFDVAGWVDAHTARLAQSLR